MINVLNLMKTKFFLQKVIAVHLGVDETSTKH